MSDPHEPEQLRLDQRAAAGIVDVFVYVVVLNLYVEYLPSVVSESFTLSLLTAVVLKIVLELVVAVEHRVKSRFRRAPGPWRRALVGTAFMLVLVGSKFLVLELVALLFGDRVSLGGFLSVTTLVVSMLVARAAVRAVLRHSFQAREAPVTSPTRPRSSGDRAPDS